MAKKAIRAIHIDTVNRTVKEVTIEPTLDALYKHTNCDCITTAMRYENNDSIFVDDEGLLKEQDTFFTVRGAYQPFAGSGILVGSNNAGETVSAKTAIDDLDVKFATRDEIRAMYQSDQQCSTHHAPKEVCRCK